jgi:hypothetical protein
MGLLSLQNNGIIVTLYPWEEQLARQVGIGRTEQNNGKGDRVSYDPNRIMSDNTLANIHSVCAELGTCRGVGAYCYAGVWEKSQHHVYSGLPDGLLLNTELEIKWRRTAQSMPVDLKDAELNRLVLWSEVRLSGCTCAECNDVERTQTKVRILGGGFASELWEMGKSYNGDANRVSVHADRLTPINELIRKVSEKL